MLDQDQQDWIHDRKLIHDLEGHVRDLKKSLTFVVTSIIALLFFVIPANIYLLLVLSSDIRHHRTLIFWQKDFQTVTEPRLDRMDDDVRETQALITRLLKEHKDAYHVEQQDSTD